MSDPYDIFACSTEEHISRDPTLSYSHGFSDAKAGRSIRGSSPEYEDGYLAGQKIRANQGEGKGR